jgi:hypothetical protein
MKDAQGAAIYELFPLVTVKHHKQTFYKCW